MDIAAASTPAGSFAADYSFLAKIVLAAALVTLADWLFFPDGTGGTAGAYAFALLAALVVASPALRRSRPAAAAAAGAALFAAILVDDPSLLALALFWVAASLAVLLPRTAGFDDAWRWSLRLLYQSVRIVFAPAADIARLRLARRRGSGTAAARIGARLPLLILPALGTALFLSLFAVANPLISDAFGRIDLAIFVGGVSFARILFWIVMLLPVWDLLRPRLLDLAAPRPGRAELPLPGVSLASVTLSLIAFNGVFALQNGLDLAFLWSGAPLPEGMTLAEYAHRGAYPLIATALLAGLFVLLTLRPGSELAGSATVRRLVYLWIGQNVLLVASTILRTLDYIDAYSLTRLRIAALVWMALVALGLLLICWRIAAARSGRWLINANAAAAALALAACSAVDLGSAAAQWNVRHAREAGGHGSALDICYLEQLGPSALLPLIGMESRPLAASARPRIAWVRNQILDRTAQDQADWRRWTWRNARRLAQADRLVAERRLPRAHAARMDCQAAPAL